MRSKEVLGVSRVSLFLTKFFGVSAFTVLLCFSALVKIPLPFTPVPVTLQNMVVFLAGALLGPVLGMSAVSLYIIIGLLGMPLFANTGAGLLYLFGPTGGYVFGFLAAAGFVGYWTRILESNNIFSLASIMGVGMGVIYLSGGLWLAIGYHWPIRQIIFLGIIPFLGPDIVKVFLAAILVKKINIH